MKKKYIKYVTGGLVALVLLIASWSSWSASTADIADEEVEEMALELKLVSMDEAEYPSIAEMEERIQAYNAGEKFAGISLKLAVFLVVAIIVITVGLSLWKLSQDKKRLIRFGIPAGGLILVFLIGRMFANSERVGINTTIPFTDGELTLVSTLINATLILLVLSFAALLTYRVKHILTK